MSFYHFNDANFNFSTPSASEGLYGYPPLSQTLTVEGTNDLFSESLTNCWDTIPKPGPMIDVSTNPWVAADNEPAAEVPSFSSGFDDHNQPLHIACLDPRLLVGDQQPQPVCTGSLNQRTYPANEAVASGSVPFDNWGDNQNEPSPSTFDWIRTGAGQASYYPVDAIPGRSVYDQHHPNSGPARRGQTPTRRFKPYGTSRARETNHWDVEEGPSTLSPLQTTEVGLQPSQPTGGLMPETAADAGINQTTTEGHEAPVTEGTSHPNGRRKPRRGRKMEQAYALELRHLVKRWKGFAKLPSRNEAAAFTLSYIQTVRLAVYSSPLLEGGRVGPSTAGLQRAGMERERRKADRMLFEALSRYYPLEGDMTRWNRPLLLKEVLEDLKVRYPPPELDKGWTP